MPEKFLVCSLSMKEYDISINPLVEILKSFTSDEIAVKENGGYATALIGALKKSSIEEIFDNCFKTVKEGLLEELRVAKGKLVDKFAASGTWAVKPGYFSKMSEDGEFLEIWVWIDKNPNAR